MEKKWNDRIVDLILRFFFLHEMIYYFHPYLPLKPSSHFSVSRRFPLCFSLSPFEGNKPLFSPTSSLHHHLFKLLKMMHFFSVSCISFCVLRKNSSISMQRFSSFYLQFCVNGMRKAIFHFFPFSLFVASSSTSHSFIRSTSTLFLIQNHKFFMWFSPQSYLLTETILQEHM
jgi:hypothetical protein